MRGDGMGDGMRDLTSFTTVAAVVAAAAMIGCAGASPQAPVTDPAQRTISPVADGSGGATNTVSAPDEHGRCKQIAASLTGLTRSEAQRALSEAGMRVRIASEDGVYFAGTMDFVPTRANLHLVAGKVTHATCG